ncbi:MAG: proline dehydrogenase [Planctomycetota bacterium]
MPRRAVVRRIPPITMKVFDRLILSTLPLVPTPVMRRLSARYIAGERLDQAVAKLHELAAAGYPGILDVLGEDVANETAAREACELYREAGRQVNAGALDTYLSVKPTHFGLRLSEELCFELYAQLADDAAQHGQFVRVEMEDHSTTDSTLRLFARLCERFDNVGIVLQSRLFRTLADIDALPAGPRDVRLVKGIYLEPAEIAHTTPAEISNAFLSCAKRLFEGGHRIAFGTHDDVLAADLLRIAAETGALPAGSVSAPERFYFEVLLGVREPLWRQWVEQGHLVRAYVPFGPEWRAYSQRRLKRNPELLGHVMRNFLHMGR